MPTFEAEDALQEVVKLSLVPLLRVAVHHLPRFVASGIFPRSVVGYLQSKLYDKHLDKNMDGPDCRFFLLFSDGRVLDRRDHSIKESSLEQYISKDTGYAYPEAEIQAIRESLSAQGLGLCAIIRRAFVHEQFAVQYETLSPTIEAELDRVAAVDGMDILRVAHASFENWAVTLCRAGKLEAARMFAERLEKFVIDNGVGSAGKTFLQMVSECCLGTYSVQIKEDLLCKDPPSPESPQPALLALRGARGFGTVELERTKKIKASWVKRLADPATIWSARPPHGRYEVKFNLYGLFSLSSNNGVEFSRVDAGVARRCIGCPYKLKFVASPTAGTNERKWLTDTGGNQVDIKEKAWLLPLMPGWIVWLLAVHRVCFQESHRGIGRLPQCMQEESDALMLTEVTDLIKQVVFDISQACEAADGLTKTQLLKAIRDDQALREYSNEQVLASLEMIAEFVTIRGKRGIVKMNDSGFVKLKALVLLFVC